MAANLRVVSTELLVSDSAVRLYPLRPVRKLRPVRDGVVEPVLRAADVNDIPAIAMLLDTYARRGLVLPRSDAQLYRMLREFVVAEHEGELIGCGALRVYSPTLGEVGALAVDERYQGNGVGRRIVERIIDDARDLGLERLLALTLEEGFFARLGFVTADRFDFPEKIAADCSTCAKRSACIEIAVALDLNA